MDDTSRDAGQKGHCHTRKWVEEYGNRVNETTETEKEPTETENMSRQKQSIEPTETENKAGRNRIRRPEGKYPDA